MEINIAVVLSVLMMMENGPAKYRPEYGRSCIRVNTLADYNDRHPEAKPVMPADLADEATERMVATDILLRHAKRWQDRTRRPATAMDLARCWKAGFSGAMAGGAMEYGGRFHKLYVEEVGR